LFYLGKEKMNDKGQAAIFLIVLAVALAVMLGAGLPVVKSKGGLDASDWLGFVGSIISSILAITAAGFAWRASQIQIRQARQQNAVVAYEALCRVLASMEKEERFYTAFRKEVERCIFPLWKLLTNVKHQVDDASINLAANQDLRLALQNIADSCRNCPSRFANITPQPWGDTHYAYLRREFFSQVELVEYEIGEYLKIEHALSREERTSKLGELDTATEGLVTHCQKISIVIYNYSVDINKEINQNFKMIVPFELSRAS
jgi:hypothetical protein